MEDLKLEFKGIVSWNFDVLFLISLNRYEPPNRAGSGLFFILITFSYLNFLKSWPMQYIGFKLADPEIVTALRIFHTL
jgi:hypothetical protein